MTEMIRRVAMAMIAKSNVTLKVDQYEAFARAAIEAMREPTGAMIDAAWCSTSISGDHPKGALSHKNKTRSRWRAMIDAALGRVDA